MVGLVLLCNQAVHDIVGIIVMTLLLGFFTGVFVALPPALYVALSNNKSKVGTRIGMGSALAGLGVLAGGPGAGAILGDVNGDLDWKDLWIYAAVLALSSGVIFAFLRVWRGGFKLLVKV